MRDLLEEEFRRLRHVQDRLQSELTLHNYRIVDTPALEPTEIFLRKSGGELASWMYSFVEPGGHRASLRPEFTSPVIRMFVDRAEESPLPVRWQYAGPVYRHAAVHPSAKPGETDEEGCAGGRQFTQVGAELIGAAGIAADAEVMALACRCLAAVGLERLRLSVGCVGTVQELLAQFQLSERAALFLLRSVGDVSRGDGGLESVREQAARLGLFRARETADEREWVASYLAAQGLAAQGLEVQNADGAPQPGTMPSMESPIGVRTPEEIAARLRRKREESDNPDRLERAMAFAAEMARLRGAPAHTLDAARDVIQRHGLDPAPLRAMEQVTEALALHDLEGVEITLDMGLVRDIAYYTGLVFEVTDGAAAPGGPLFLAGGGRYDGLVKALGADRDAPALGFACTVESVLDALMAREPSPPPLPQPTRVLVAHRSAGAYRHALRVAAGLRTNGEATEVALLGADAGDGRSYARSRGMQAVVIVEDNGRSERHGV
jgi:histidyl-tRNA synthetase